MPDYPLNLADNYIYLFHTDEWLLLPQYPDTMSDMLSSTFSQQNVLSRTAPIYAYSYSGPREVKVSLDLPRDLIDAENIRASNMKVNVEEGEDYVDTLIRKIQAIALPRYDASNKTVVPPMVAVRFGKDIFIKGVVNGGISIDYQKPILDDGKYSRITLSFSVYETTPFDAESVSRLGSFRGLTKQFKNGIYKSNGE